jgi:capsular polysaccharide biosynthesis protein
MTELRTPPRRQLPPDFDAEEEVDLSRYGRALASRWWLPVVGLVLGVIVGYLISLGSGNVYEAKTTIYLGQPFSGSSPIQSLATNPRTVNEIVHNESVLRRVSRASDMRPGQLRNNVSTKQLSAGRGAARTGTTQLVELTVKGDAPRKVTVAANALADRVVQDLSPFVNDKIRAFESQLAASQRAIDSVDRRITILNASVSGVDDPLEQLVLVSQLDNAEQRREQLVDEQAETQQLLALAERVEKPQVVEPALARKTTARSARNTMIVVGLIGLLLGIVAAVAWEPLARRLNR